MLEEDDGSIESVSSKSVPDGENPESDDDLDSIPNLFRNRAALKAAFTGSQDKEKGRSIENAQGKSQFFCENYTWKPLLFV